MKPPESQSGQLLQLLAGLPVTPDDPALAGRRRDQVVAHVASVMKDEQQRARRRRWRPLVAALLAAAMLIVVLGAVRSVRHARESAVPSAVATEPAGRARAVDGTVLVARGGALSPVAAQKDTELQTGDELRTAAQGGATVVLATGVIINAGPATTVSIGAVRQEPAGRDDIVLTMGRVDLSVPKLPPGRSFAVRTPDSEVVVHGTRFSVTVSSPSPGAPVTTSVQVTEGLVSVSHAGGESWLTRGETWSSSAEPAVAPRVGPPAGSAEPWSATLPSSHPIGATAPAGVSARSSLAEENSLFQAAMDAKRRGDDRAVLGALERLLSRYPTSPLAPDARVERFRALKRLGDEKGAAREARRYLAENPDGFARDEARDTVLSPAPSSSALAH